MFRHGGVRGGYTILPPWNKLPAAPRFALVRDPLPRLVSAYFTIAGRYWSKPRTHHAPTFAFMHQQSDELRFEGMVDTMLQLDGALPAGGDCASVQELIHAVPQTWFIGTARKEMEWVGRLESLRDDLQNISDLMHLGPLPVLLIVDKQCSPVTRKCPNASYAGNRAEGRCGGYRTHADCTNATTDSLQKAVMSSARIRRKVMRYLEADYECLGYSRPSAEVD